jgi:hypothetical protein
LRRIVVIATALAVLAAAVSAYAAGSGLNTYKAKLKFSPNKAKATLGFTQRYTAGGTNGNRTAPLTNIKTTIYGLKPSMKGIPTCTQAQIAAAKSDTGCPKGAMLGKGEITAVLGPANDQSATAPGLAPCDPLLHAWNGGHGKIVYFFVDQGPNHLCAGGAVPTGFVGPFTGTVKTVGKTLVMNTPIPQSVSFPLAGVEGSLTSETLTWLKVTGGRGVKAKTPIQSVGCKKGKRPYSVAFTAQEPGGAPSTQTVTGTQKCK